MVGSNRIRGLKWGIMLLLITLATSTLSAQDFQHSEHRREVLSIKTNLLYDAMYMPGYDAFAPIPNVALEYYPKKGHITFGGGVDIPWYENNKDHKVFQVANYQLFSRYYLHTNDTQQGAAYRGLYFSAYAHGGMYSICFNNPKGREGEGFGGGIGAGYVLGLGKSQHWRLEFGLQMGVMYTQYGHYAWFENEPGIPDGFQTTDPSGLGHTDKRPHHYTWIGPTRLEITLSYDLLYRKNHGKGISFRGK